jgi:hypothetical protein
MDDTGFAFDDVVEDVCARVTGQTATAEDVLKIQRGMRIVTETWNAAGYNTWRTRLISVGIDGASREVPLPKDVDDIVSCSVQSGDRSETVMTRKSFAAYAQIAIKNQRGQPTQYFLHRKVKPEMFIYPIGGFQQYRLNIYYMARPEAFNMYENVLADIPGRWLEALICSLASDLSRKTPPFDNALIQRLQGEAGAAIDRALRTDRDRTPYQFRRAVRGSGRRRL